MNMSNGTRTKQERSNKVRALEEVVGLLKKHVQHRELEINDLGSQLRQSNDKIRNLEKKLDQKNTEESRVKSLRHDKENIHKKLKSIQNEREELKRKIDLTKIEKEDALKASRKAREDLHFERKKQDMMRSNGLTSHPQTKKHQEKSIGYVLRFLRQMKAITAKTICFQNHSHRFGQNALNNVLFQFSVLADFALSGFLFIFLFPSYKEAVE